MTAINSSKKLFSLLLVLGVTFFYQQNLYAQTNNFGAETGINFSNVNGTDFETDIRTGIFLGLYYRYMLVSGPFFIQPELLYTQRGFKNEDITIALDYITLNMLLSYYLTQLGPIKPVFKFGPYLSYNISAKEKFEGNEHDIDDFVKSTDVGLLLRAGVQRGRVEAGLRLAQGLSTVFDNENSEEKTFLIGFFVGFNL